MTDFDFDELDKAVNTVLGGNEPEPAAPKEVSQPAPTRPAPAMRRSSGRFMDVVHPSSDMRATSPAQVSKNIPSPVNTAPPAPTVDTAEHVSDSLDDFDWKTPLDSPFLPDAQVEKRPLGGSAPTGPQLMLDEPDELRLEEPDELRLEAPDPHIMPDPLDFAEASATEEIIEEKADDTTLADVVAVVEPEQVISPVNSETASDTDLSHAAALDAEDHFVPGAEEAASAAFGESPRDQAPVEEPEVTGPVSITQQYKEKPVETAETGSIYDTENYHQPITAPVKKKSGAWVILWIVLILLLGGGGGAAFYFYVLPML